MDIQDVKIGDKVRIVHYGKKSFPMTVVGIFSSMTHPHRGTLYLDFEGNTGDVWEEEVEDVEKAE